MNPTLWDHHDRDDDGRFNRRRPCQHRGDLRGARNTAVFIAAILLLLEANTMNLTLDGVGDTAKDTHAISLYLPSQTHPYNVVNVEK